MYENEESDKFDRNRTDNEKEADRLLHDFVSDYTNQNGSD